MRVIGTKFLGPTNHRPSRIKADAGGGAMVMLSWDSVRLEAGEQNPHAFAARVLCVKMGWEGELIGGTRSSGDMVWIPANSKERA